MTGKRSPMLVSWFARYTTWYLKRNFNSLRCSLAGGPPTVNEGQSAIIYLNHPSWWDPLICLQLAMTYWPTRQHFAPIDAAALRQYPMLNRLGFFAVERSTRRGAVEFLKEGSAILSEPNTMLWITAKGEFTDVRNQDRTLMPGFVHLAERIPGVAVIPLAIEYAFWHERRPEALCRFGKVVEPTLPIAQQALRSTQNALAAEAIAQQPELFRTVLQGRGGVQPLYDAWRYVKALLHGESFSSKHEREDA